jgi:hypothetical protein
VLNTLLRVVLVLWIVGYLAIACAPLLADNAVSGGVGFVAGIVLLVPWLIGVAVIGAFIWMTNPHRR